MLVAVLTRWLALWTNRPSHELLRDRAGRAAGAQDRKHLFALVEHLRDAVTGRDTRTCPVPQLAILHQPRAHARPGRAEELRRAGRYDLAAIADNALRIADVGRYHGGAAGHRLGGDVGEAFTETRRERARLLTMSSICPRPGAPHELTPARASKPISGAACTGRRRGRWRLP